MLINHHCVHHIEQNWKEMLAMVQHVRKITKEETVLVKSGLIDFKTSFITIPLFYPQPLDFHLNKTSVSVRII